MGQTDNEPEQHTASAPEPARQDDGARLDWDKVVEHAGDYAFFRKCYQRGVERCPDDVFMTDEDKVLRYEAKPLRVWLSAGLAACGLLWLQHYIFLHHHAWGDPFGENTGWVRFGLFILAAICGFIAWPWRRTNPQTAGEQEQTEQVRLKISRRRRY